MYLNGTARKIFCGFFTIFGGDSDYFSYSQVRRHKQEVGHKLILNLGNNKAPNPTDSEGGFGPIGHCVKNLRTLFYM